MKTLRRALPGLLVVAVVATARGQESESRNPLDHWETVAQSVHSLRGIACLNGRFVAVGHASSVIVSSNGTDWFSATNGLSQWEGLLGVAAGAGQFVAVGGPGGAILSSPDGFHWTRRHTLLGAEFWAVTFAAEQFVAVGFSNPGTAISASSPDGVVWDVRNVPISTTPRNLAYGNRTYVAASAPVSMRSTNGRDWEPIPTIVAQGIAFDGTRFIATLITNGFTSDNGSDWTSLPLPVVAGPGSEQNYYTARHANGVTLVGGHAGRHGLIAVSVRGAPFSLIPELVRQEMGAIRDAVFVDGRFYVADQSGKVWRSGRMTPYRRPVLTSVSRTDGRARLRFAAPAGFFYTLECTDHIAPPVWRPYSEGVFASEEECSATDSDASGQTRYYRLRLQEGE